MAVTHAGNISATKSNRIASGLLRPPPAGAPEIVARLGPHDVCCYGEGSSKTLLEFAVYALADAARRALLFREISELSRCKLLSPGYRQAVTQSMVPVVLSAAILAGTPLLHLRGGQRGTETPPSYLMPPAIVGGGPAYMAPCTQSSVVRWDRLRSLLDAPVDADNSDITTDHPNAARTEAASKLISNHLYVLKDCTHTYPCTQTGLARVAIGLADFADQALREIARRLLVDRAGAPELEERIEASSAEQKAAWRGVATFLDGRLQVASAQHPGRQADMSESAAAAMRTVLQEIAADADCAMQSHPAPPCERSDPQHHLLSPFYAPEHFAGA